jgi:hypothetical protein
MRSAIRVFIWRKLNGPGHDACQLIPTARGYELLGGSVFLESKRVCQLGYHVVASTSFLTQRASVKGFIGSKSVDLRIRASARGRWAVNGVDQRAAAGCLDFDLGFTPATNLLAIRRLRLSVGKEADAPAAYLAFPLLKLSLLEQRYKRVSQMEYDYEAPQFGYRGVLKVSAMGAVIEYPKLFSMEEAK